MALCACVLGIRGLAVLIHSKNEMIVMIIVISVACTPWWWWTPLQKLVSYASTLISYILTLLYNGTIHLFVIVDRVSYTQTMHLLIYSRGNTLADTLSQNMMLVTHP